MINEVKDDGSGVQQHETIRPKLLKQIIIDLFLVASNLATDGLCFLKKWDLSQESIR